MATTSLAVPPVSRPMLWPALLLTAGMTVVILSALAFEHIGQYVPCALCLIERWPYYVAIPIGILAVLSSAMNAPPAVARTLLLLAGLSMLIGGGIGVYHAGAEWKFWPGPSTCATSVDAVTKNAGDLLDAINTQHGPSCTDASLRILGLSFAGWNVVASAVLAGIAVFGATRKA
jgi:disulfide bond formation protein DsbB